MKRLKSASVTIQKHHTVWVCRCYAIVSFTLLGCFFFSLLFCCRFFFYFFCCAIFFLALSHSIMWCYQTDVSVSRENLITLMLLSHAWKTHDSVTFSFALFYLYRSHSPYNIFIYIYIHYLERVFYERCAMPRHATHTPCLTLTAPPKCMNKTLEFIRFSRWCVGNQIIELFLERRIFLKILQQKWKPNNLTYSRPMRDSSVSHMHARTHTHLNTDTYTRMYFYICIKSTQVKKKKREKIEGKKRMNECKRARNGNKNRGNETQNNLIISYWSSKIWIKFNVEKPAENWRMMEKCEREQTQPERESELSAEKCERHKKLST